MADIFLSYKRTDRERVASIIGLLESCGWSVWWDTRIDAGEKWDEIIEREINAANCVVAVWSFESIASRWVRTEASEGLERGILVPVFIDATKPPLEFKLIQSVDLVGWRGDRGDPAARAFVQAIGRLLGEPPAGVGQSPPVQVSGLDPRSLPDQERSQREQEHWDLIRRSRDPGQFSTFLAAYPKGRHARAAEARLDQLALRHASAKRTAWAGLLGLIGGLLIVVPAVLWLSGWLGGPQTKTVARTMAADQPPVKVPEVKIVKVDSQPPAAKQPPVPVPAKRMEPPRSRVDELLAAARRRIESGDVAGAREILQSAELAKSAPMIFMLAETYDPSMLASWQTRGVYADPVRARLLYEKARELGDRRAEQRLDWLSGN